MLIFTLCAICSASKVSEYAERLGVGENFKLLGERSDLFYRIEEECSENFRVTDIKENGLSQEVEILAAIEFLQNQNTPCVRTFITSKNLMQKALGIEDHQSCMKTNVNNGATACDTFDTDEMKWVVSMLAAYQGTCLQESTPKLHLCERSGFNCGSTSIPTIGWKKTVKNQAVHQLESREVTDIDNCIKICSEEQLCDLVVYDPFEHNCAFIQNSWSDGLSCTQMSEAYTSKDNSVAVKVKSTQHEDFCYIGILNEPCQVETTSQATTPEVTTTTKSTTTKVTTEPEKPSTTPIPIIFATPSTPPPTFAPTTITISTTIGVIGTTTTGG